MTHGLACISPRRLYPPGPLQPDVHRRRAARADAGVGLAEPRQVRFAGAVEIADVDAVFIMNAVFEWDALQTVLAQAVLAAEEDEHLVGLAVGDDQVIDAVAVPVGNDRRVADQRMFLALLRFEKQLAERD